ncbi:MAG: M1 family aminopeptidase [Phycisphaerae bacterium]
MDVRRLSRCARFVVSNPRGKRRPDAAVFVRAAGGVRRARATRPLLAGAWLVCGVALVSAATPRFAVDRPIDLQHLRLAMSVDLVQQRVDAVATLDLSALRRVASVTLDALDLDVHGVRGDFGDETPADLRFVNTGRAIEILLPREFERGERLRVSVDYTVTRPTTGLHFYAPSDDDPDAPYQVWSQGESIENRAWIPCFDHPDERFTSELFVTADERYKVLSNGRLVSRKSADGFTTWHYAQNQSHVAYLVTLVVGDFAIIEESWRGIPVQYWVPPRRVVDVGPTFGRTRAMLEFFSDRLGVDYPWDKYAQICCYDYGGGMENTSATTLGENTLRSRRALLDGDADDLLAHELFHQWWGDLLTCRDWAHLWLNEGFATYGEVLWFEHDHGPDRAALELWSMSESARRGGRARPIVDRYYNHADDMFDDRAYPKGGWVLHMLRCQLGDELFFKTLREYAQRHAHASVETSDLRRAAEGVSGRSLERFFYDWTERPGHPVVEVEYRWDQERGGAVVAVKQTPAEPAAPRRRGGADKPPEPAEDAERPPWEVAPPREPFHFPLTLEFRVPGEPEPVVVRRMFTTASETIVVPLSAAPTLFRVDPDQTVLMELRETKPRELWLTQLRSDPHVAGRLRAIESLKKDAPPQVVEALAAALSREPFWGVQNAIAAVLGERRGDAARNALLAAIAPEDEPTPPRDAGVEPARAAVPRIRALRDLAHGQPAEDRSARPPGSRLADARARRACVEALGRFRDDDRVGAALRALIRDGDESEAVEAAALTAYAALEPPDLRSVVAPALTRDSHREQIRNAALNAFARLPAPEALELLAEWTTADRPRECRRTAVAALARALTREPVEAALDARAIECLLTCTAGADARLRAAAAQALGDFGQRADAAIPALQTVAERDRSERVRRAAEAALDRIRSDAPLRRQFDELREQLRSLQQQNRDLRGKLEAIERR